MQNPDKWAINDCNTPFAFASFRLSPFPFIHSGLPSYLCFTIAVSAKFDSVLRSVHTELSLTDQSCNGLLLTD